MAVDQHTVSFSLSSLLFQHQVFAELRIGIMNLGVWEDGHE